MHANCQNNEVKSWCSCVFGWLRVRSFWFLIYVLWKHALIFIKMKSACTQLREAQESLPPPPPPRVWNVQYLSWSLFVMCSTVYQENTFLENLCMQFMHPPSMQHQRFPKAISVILQLNNVALRSWGYHRQTALASSKGSVLLLWKSPGPIREHHVKPFHTLTTAVWLFDFNKCNCPTF